MSKRTKYVTTVVDEDTFQSIIDAGNIWGDSISAAAYKLVQRGIVSLNQELGSKTPVHIQVARINQDLNTVMTTKQRIVESYRLALELGKEKEAQQLQALAKGEGIELSQDGS
jgi:hypothetical protein